MNTSNVEQKLRRVFFYLNKFFMVPMFRLGVGPWIGSPFGGYIIGLKSRRAENRQDAICASQLRHRKWKRVLSRRVRRAVRLVNERDRLPGPPYWGKYVFHDNNRDINYGVDSLRAHLNWYLEWVPPVWHDVHEAQTLLYTFSGQPPQNPNLDPLLYTELPFFATYEVNKMTGYGMPGVWHFGFVDMWSPGYLGFSAANHNGMLRMYEVFKQGGANTKKARLQGSQTTRQWYRPNPAPAGEVDWSIRNSINYAQTGLLTALELTSKFPSMVVENFYRKSANGVTAGSDKPPHGFVIPAGQRDPTQVDRAAQPVAPPGYRGSEIRARLVARRVIERTRRFTISDNYRFRA